MEKEGKEPEVRCKFLISRLCIFNFSTSSIMTSNFRLLASDFQLFTFDPVRDEARGEEGVENFCALDDLLIYWGGRK